MISFSQTGGTSGITTISISATSNSELVNLVNDYTLGNGNGHSLLMPIIQKAYVPTEKYITFSPVTMSIGSSGGTESLNVQSNDNWVIVADDWIQLSRFMDIDRGPQTISGDGNTIIGIRLFENIGEARTGTISGYCVSDSSITASTVVSQAGSYVKPYIVLGSYSADVQYNASSYTFSVSSNTSWNVTTDARWVTLNTLSGTGNSNVSYSVLANSGEHRRTATITVFNADEGITANFTLVQEAEQEYPYIKVEPNSFNVSWSGTSGNVISVSANCDYDITTDVAWITTNAASGSGNGSVSFTTLPNSSSSDVGNIVLANSAVSQVVTIQRQAVGKYLSASTNYISSSSTGGTFEVSVYSNVNWTVSVDTGEETLSTPWLSATPVSGSNDGTLRISVASGTTEISGSVVLMNLEYDLTYTIDVDREELLPTKLTAIYYTDTPNQMIYLFSPYYIDEFIDALSSIEVDGVLTTQDYPGYTFATAGEHVVVYDFKDNTTLIHGAFFYLGEYSMSRIYIPYGMNNIGAQSFQICYNLTEITFPNGVTNIPDAILTNCNSLTSVTLPNSVSAIGSDFLSSCPGVRSLTLPKNLRTIDNNGFLMFQYTLNEIIAFPTTAPTIGGGILSIYPTGTLHYPSGSDYSSWISKLPSGWTAVDDITLNGYLILSTTGITVDGGTGTTGNKITITSDMSYNISTNVSWITLSDSTGSRNKTITFNTSAAPSTAETSGVITISSSSITRTVTVTRTGYYPKLPNLIYYTTTGNTLLNPYMTSGWGATIVSNTYSNGVGILEFDGDVTTIPYYSFGASNELESIIIPNNVTTIEGYAFQSCRGLKEVTIGSGVTSIGTEPFDWCYALDTIYVYPTTAPTFGGLGRVADKGALYCPFSSKGYDDWDSLLPSPWVVYNVL